MKKVKQNEKIPSQYGSEIKPDFLKARTIKMPSDLCHISDGLETTDGFVVIHGSGMKPSKKQP